MKRQAIRGLVLLLLLVAVVDSTVRGQNTPDKVTVRDRKDGSTKSYEGVFQVSPAGFQVVGGDKKILVTVNPDDVLKVGIGDLPGVDRNLIIGLNAKEDKKEWADTRTGYQDLLKKSAGAPERTRRYLEFKVAQTATKIVDELDEKAWAPKAEEAAKVWGDFLRDHKTGWELWPAVRTGSRLLVELGKYEDASRAWGRVAKNADIPPDARVEAGIQEIDLQVRGKAYSVAATGAADLAKTAAGAKKDRLTIYEIAAKAGADGKPLDGVDKIKAEMDKTKDPSVHATGYSMLGELYLAGGKPRDAMWSFLWVETVLNQDKEEAFKAVSRLAVMFETQMDEEQARKYRDKLKRLRATF